MTDNRGRTRPTDNCIIMRGARVHGAVIIRFDTIIFS